MKIAFFDSGIGGLTVLYEALSALQPHHYLYYADTHHVPYGTKDKDLVRQYIMDAADFLVNLEPDMLVIACNTATSVGIRHLREKYDIPVIGMEPAIKPALNADATGKVLLCATKTTIREKKLARLISRLDAENRVDTLDLQELVAFAEAFDFEGSAPASYLEKKLAGYDWSETRSLVLGCTHFLYYKRIISQLIPDHVRIIDGNKGTVRQIKRFIDSAAASHAVTIDYYESGHKTGKDRFEKYLAFYKENYF